MSEPIGDGARGRQREDTNPSAKRALRASCGLRFSARSPEEPVWPGQKTETKRLSLLPAARMRPPKEVIVGPHR